LFSGVRYVVACVRAAARREDPSIAGRVVLIGNVIRADIGPVAASY